MEWQRINWNQEIDWFVTEGDIEEWGNLEV